MSTEWNEFREAEARALQEYKAREQARQEEEAKKKTEERELTETRYQKHKSAMLASWVAHVKEHGNQDDALYVYDDDKPSMERFVAEVMAQGYYIWWRDGPQKNSILIKILSRFDNKR